MNVNLRSPGLPTALLLATSAFAAQGDIYTLNAFKNGEWVQLRIDAENGGVTVVE